MILIARILNLKNRYQSLREFECTLINLSGKKMKLSGKTYIIIIFPSLFAPEVGLAGGRYPYPIM